MLRRTQSRLPFPREPREWPRRFPSYSSDAGDGLVGLGWSVSGLPTIERCPRTYAQDNVHGSINYNANDRFCLNGQRLMVINGGTYGAAGSEYRTEIETFSKIIAHGSAGTGPAWFEVHTKSGIVMEFGNTADSQILPVKADGSGLMSSARVWALNKIYDTKGNYLTVTYTDDTTNGQFYPITILYTGHAASPVVAPYNSVTFTYASRPDVTTHYQAGAKVVVTKRLTNVKTHGPNTDVLDYRLAYEALDPVAHPTWHSRLSTITLCDGNGANCLPATTFTWQGSRDSITPTLVQQSVGSSGLIPGDWNGDGLTDFSSTLDAPPSTSAARPVPLPPRPLRSLTAAAAPKPVHPVRACQQRGGGASISSATVLQIY